MFISTFLPACTHPSRKYLYANNDFSRSRMSPYPKFIQHVADLSENFALGEAATMNDSES